MPSISTGIYRFLLDLAAQIAVSTVADAGGTLEHVSFVCFDEATSAAYDAGLRATR